MSDLLVVMGCTKESGLQPMYLSQLQEAGIKYHVEKLNKASDCIGDLFEIVLRILAKFPDIDYFVFTDAWDVLFYGSKEDVLAKIKAHKILMGAERNCYPDHTMEPMIPGETPWKFANGGMLAGHRSHLASWIKSVVSNRLYNPSICNQGLLNLMMAYGSKMPLDSQTDLFYCLSQEKGELQFESGIPVNKALGTKPNFIHFNGKFPVAPILERMERSLGKPAPEMDELVDVTIPMMVKLKLCRRCGDRVLQGN